MPQPKMQTMVIVDAEVLTNAVIEQVMTMLGHFDSVTHEGRKLSREEAKQLMVDRGYIPIWTEIVTTQLPLGPTIKFRNHPADIELVVPWHLVRYIVRVPAEGQALAGVGFPT